MTVREVLQAVWKIIATCIQEPDIVFLVFANHVEVGEVVFILPPFIELLPVRMHRHVKITKQAQQDLYEGRAT